MINNAFPLHCIQELAPLNRLANQDLLNELLTDHTNSFKSLSTIAYNLAAKHKFFQGFEDDYSYNVTNTVNKKEIEFRFYEPNTITLYEICSRGKKQLFLNNIIQQEKIVEPQKTLKTIAAKKVKDKFKNKPAIPQEICQLYEDYGFKKEKYKKLKPILRVVPAENIIQLLKKFEEKEAFLNTILKISKGMKNQNSWKNLLFGSQLIFKYEEEDSFAFALNHKTAIVVHEFFAYGTYKDVSTAYVLNTQDKIVEIESFGVQLSIEEKELLDAMARNNPDLIPPYECVIEDKKDDKLIMFQHCFDGNGINLAKASLSPLQLYTVFRDVARGLAKMHDDGYIHSDFKLANMLYQGQLKDEGAIVTKVADIGLAQRINTKFMGGTPIYMPAEVISFDQNGAKHYHGLADPKIDSFSLGAVMLQLLEGKEDENTLFSSLTSNQLNSRFEPIYNNIIANKSYFPFEMRLMINIYDLTLELLQHDAEARISCKEVTAELNKLLI